MSGPAQHRTDMTTPPVSAPSRRPRTGRGVRSLIGALAAVFTLWVTPRRTVLRSLDVSLPAAWLAHVLAALLTVGVVIVGVAFLTAASKLGRSGADDAFLLEVLLDIVVLTIRELTKLWPEVWRELLSDDEVPLILSVVVFQIELAFMLLAFCAMLWGAQDEPHRQTWRHALRTTWLWTGTAWPFTAGLCLAVGALEWYTARWEPLPPVGSAMTPQAWQAWWTSRPWIVRHEAELIFLGVLALSALALCVLLRAVGTKRPRPPRARPPICESCGYNLSHTPLDSRCPECGTAVRESHRPGLRQPKDWEREGGLLADGAMVRCAVEAALRPTDFFRTMQTRHGLRRARTFFVAAHAVAVLVIAPICGVWIGVWVSKGRIGDDLLAIVCAGVTVGLLTLLWPLGMGALLSLSCRSRWKTDVMPGVAKVFYYTHGLFLVLATAYAFMWGPIGFLIRLADDLNWDVGDWEASLAIAIGWMVCVGLVLLWHLHVVLIGVRQIRYANS